MRGVWNILDAPEYAASRIRAAHRDSAHQIPSDRAAHSPARRNGREMEVRGSELKYETKNIGGGQRPTSEVVEGVQVKSETVWVEGQQENDLS